MISSINNSLVNSFKPFALKEKKLRIWEIDFFRGFAVVFMMLDHLMYDFSSFSRMWSQYITAGDFMYNMGSLASQYWSWDFRIGFRIFIVALFFVASGTSSSFSKNNLLRGARLLLVAFLLTVITHIGKELSMINFTIDIGVLHCLAFAILLYECLKIAKVDNYTVAVIGALFVVFGYMIEVYSIYATNDTFAIFGLATGAFKSRQGDYFPLLPWAGLLFIGGSIGRIVYKGRKSIMPKLGGSFQKPLAFLGRHALLFYFGHQVVFFGTFYLVGMILGYN